MAAPREAQAAHYHQQTWGHSTRIWWTFPGGYILIYTAGSWLDGFPLYGRGGIVARQEV